MVMLANKSMSVSCANDVSLLLLNKPRGWTASCSLFEKPKSKADMQFAVVGMSNCKTVVKKNKNQTLWKEAESACAK